MKYILRLISGLIALALIVSAYGGTIDPRDWSLPGLATLALSGLTVVTAVWLGLMLICRQWRSVVILLLAIAVCWPSLRLVVPFHPNKPTVAEEQLTGDTLRVLTMNVREFNRTDKVNPSKSMRYILNQDADIVVLQEGTVYFEYDQIASLKTMVNDLYRQYPYRSEGLFDVGILSKYPIEAVHDPVLVENQTDYFVKAWNVQTPGGDVRVYSMHLQSLGFIDSDLEMKKRSRSQVANVTNKLREGLKQHAGQAHQLRTSIDHAPANVLVMGDMNETTASYGYRTVRGDDLRDAWADVGRGIPYTYHYNRLFVKIDHIFYRGNLLPVTCQCVRAGDSDHYPVVATFVRLHDSEDTNE